MKISAYARAQAAQVRLDVAHAALVRSAAPLRASLRRHPALWLLGGGFGAGLAAGFLPVHRWISTGVSLASMLMRVMTPFLAGIEAAAGAGSALATPENRPEE